MRVAATSEPPADVAADALAVAVLADEPPALPEAAALLDRGEARARAGHVAVTHLGDRPLIVVGLGPRDALTGEVARRAAAALRRRAGELRATTLAVALPSELTPEVVAGFVSGIVLSAYRFDRLLADDDSGERTLDSLLVVVPAELAGEVERAATIADAQNRARDLGNTPPNLLTPTALAEYALALAERHDEVGCDVIDEDEIRLRGMGAFAAVAQGSAQPARLITLTYDGPGVPSDAPRLALIGKAVTFDSGGLNLKPGPSMIGMKFDMCGGAAVIETVAALAALAAPVRVLAVVGATENMTGAAAMRPGDVLTAADGTTIEMNNADAEGRLVLADCILHARDLGCDAIVDVATLTGAVVVALGTAFAGMMSSDDALADALLAAGETTGERLWRLPLDPLYAEMMKGRIARLSNQSRPPRQAGSITAAEFLHHFAGDVPWAHLDIAGVADDVSRPYNDSGATGFGVRLLTELALSGPVAP